MQLPRGHLQVHQDIVVYKKHVRVYWNAFRKSHTLRWLSRTKLGIFRSFTPTIWFSQGGSTANSIHVIANRTLG